MPRYYLYYLVCYCCANYGHIFFQDNVKKDDLEYAIERVIAGPEKKTSVLNPIVRLFIFFLMK